jgi:hypothetical protein
VKYRKKPVVIEAVQFTPDDPKANDEMIQHLEGCTGWRMEGTSIVIPTLEGDHKASPGDFIIKGVKGEFYPCKPDIFAATYDQAEA